MKWEESKDRTDRGSGAQMVMKRTLAKYGVQQSIYTPPSSSLSSFSSSLPPGEQSGNKQKFDFLLD